MKKSMKSVLLSAFVFPGVGHFYLKRKKTGILLAVISFAALYFLISNIMQKAVQISAKIQSGDIPFDVHAISERLLDTTSGNDIQQLNLATSVFVLCWILSIIDSYRVGHAQDKNDDAL